MRFKLSRVHYLTSLLGLALLLAGGCGETASPPVTTGTASGGAPAGAAPKARTSFKLGLAAPLTGDQALIGKMMRGGVEIAIERLNAEGGVRGARIELTLGDDAGNPKEAATVAQKFASDPDVLAAIGDFNSSCTLAGKPIYKEARLLQITPASTNATICEGSEWTFRNIYRDDFQGRFLARYVKEALELSRVGIFYDNDDYGIGLRDSFLEEARRLGLAVVATQAYERDTSDFRPQLTAFLPQRPEILFVAGLFPQAAKIASQARESGIQLPLIGGDGVFSDEYIENGGPAAEGTYVSCPFLFELGGPEAKEFQEAFRKKYGIEADGWAALAYDAVGLVAQALEKGGLDREALRAEMAKINSPDVAYPGLTGATYFDENGDCRKPIQMALVKQGKFVPAPKQLGEDLSGVQGAAR